MKVPLSWLKEYIDINLVPAEIAKLLTMAGLEVEAIESVEINFEKIIVAEVLHAEAHPNADQLKLATVFDGTDKWQVVCGAPNCRAGIKVAFAPIGAQIKEPNGEIFKIKKAKLRGIESFGMLCSGKELNISEEAEGILELDSHLDLGTSVADLYADSVFDIALTPNLGHCASVLGVARELSALTGIPLKKREDTQYPEIKRDILDIKIEAKEECPRYAACLIKGVEVRQSEEWLKRRLQLAGVRSINQVVDVTNYVMLELGHPLHAFDYDKIKGKQIVVRMAKKDEELTALDGKLLSLNEKDLVVCDAEKPLALAGVIGGLNSEVDFESKNILLEAAFFIPTCVRKMSKERSIATESSKRFERSTDPNNIIFALMGAAALIEKLSGGKLEVLTDISVKDFKPKKIILRLKRVNQLLGAQLSLGEVESIFKRLDYKIEVNNNEELTIAVPTFRQDLNAEIDLIEEVARFYGYDKFDAESPKMRLSGFSHAPIYLFEKQIRNYLLAEGLQEFLTCDLISKEQSSLGLLPEENNISLLKPSSIEQSILRTSLLPGLIEVVRKNAHFQVKNLSGFEVGKVHYKEEDKYREQMVAAVILTGRKAPYAIDQKENDVDFYDLKGIMQNLFQETGVEGVEYLKSEVSLFHPGRQAIMSLKGLKIGTLGQLHPLVLKKYDIDQPVYFAEVNMHDLYKLRSKEKQMNSVPLYPGSDRDLTLTLKEDLQIGNLLNEIRKFNFPLLKATELIDIYRSDKVGKGLKNVTLRFTYRDDEKTVAQTEVDEVHSKVCARIEENFNK